MPSGTGARAALEDVAALGPFFAISANPAEEVDPSWTPWRRFYDDPAPMAARVDLVARTLGTADRRVAASIALQGLAARLVSPLVAVAAVHRLVPSWTPDSLHWRVAVSGPWPMWESAPDGARGGAAPGGPGEEPDDAELAASVAAALVEPHLTALVQVTRAVESVSGQVLRGNAASAIAAAATMVARARPAAATTAAAIATGLLETGLLAGAGGFTGGPAGGITTGPADGLATEWSFRRRSCCLYYRIPGGGTCGDCVLVPSRR